ncbi:MAG TPA: hypothetical protein VM845_07355, partial [Burkholderiaceae bacterium]|nr:hypothetical protein [Burkholderiaceae bacterium]
ALEAAATTCRSPWCGSKRSTAEARPRVSAARMPASRARATAQRELKARAHRDAVEARNKERGAKKPSAAPLPVPATPASAPR